MTKKLLINNFFIVSIGSVIGILIRLHFHNVFYINIVGCFILGFSDNLRISNKLKLLIGFAFCGSITTFSSWIGELFWLLKYNLYINFFFNIFSFLTSGYISVYLGCKLARKYNSIK